MDHFALGEAQSGIKEMETSRRDALRVGAGIATAGLVTVALPSAVSAASAGGEGGGGGGGGSLTANINASYSEGGTYLDNDTERRYTYLNYQNTSGVDFTLGAATASSSQSWVYDSSLPVEWSAWSATPELFGSSTWNKTYSTGPLLVPAGGFFVARIRMNVNFSTTPVISITHGSPTIVFESFDTIVWD